MDNISFLVMFNQSPQWELVNHSLIIWLKVINSIFPNRHTHLFTFVVDFLWQITPTLPSGPVSRVMTHSNVLLGVAVRKDTPFFTMALLGVKKKM